MPSNTGSVGTAGRADRNVSWRLKLPVFRYYSPKPLAPDILASADQTGLLLIHVPKNGGTSVSEVLHGREYGHVPAVHVAAFHPFRFRRLVKIAVIREPTSRFLSAFDYLSLGGNNAFDRHFAQRFVMQAPNAEQFLQSLQLNKSLARSVRQYFHFRPQSYYISHRAKLMINRIIRMDHLDEDLAAIVGRETGIRRINATTGKRTRESDLSDASLSFLHRIYALDYHIWQHRDALAASSDLYGRPLP